MPRKAYVTRDTRKIVQQRQMKLLRWSNMGMNLLDILTALQKEGDTTATLESIKKDLAEGVIAQSVTNGMDAEITRELEVARLESYLKFLYPQIAQGDVKAVGTAMRISALKCDILGLYKQNPKVMDELMALQVLANAAWLAPETANAIGGHAEEFVQRAREVLLQIVKPQDMGETITIDGNAISGK